MAQMLNSTVVPAIALAASLEELASLVDHATDFEYLSVGVQVASCVRHVSAVLAGRPVPIPRIEHSRQRGLSALRATVLVSVRAMGVPRSSGRRRSTACSAI